MSTFIAYLVSWMYCYSKSASIHEKQKKNIKCYIPNLVTPPCWTGEPPNCTGTFTCWTVKVQILVGLAIQTSKKHTNNCKCVVVSTHLRHQGDQH